MGKRYIYPHPAENGAVGNWFGFVNCLCIPFVLIDELYIFYSGCIMRRTVRYTLNAQPIQIYLV